MTFWVPLKLQPMVITWAEFPRYPELKFWLKFLLIKTSSPSADSLLCGGE